MKVKIQSPIQVGGHGYKIVFSNKTGDDDDWGQLNHKDLIIRLNPKLKNVSVLRQTLIHELDHAVDWVYVSRELQERQIYNISQGWNQIFDQLGIEFDFSDIETEDE